MLLPAAEFDWDSRDCLYMGTVDYSSVRSLQGHHPCAWDDLEGLAITLLEMATGVLCQPACPWRAEGALHSLLA